MKLQFDSNTRTDKNRQCITGGIFYCRLVLKSTVVARIKLRVGLTDLLRNRQQKHTAKPLPTICKKLQNIWKFKINVVTL